MNAPLPVGKKAKIRFCFSIALSLHLPHRRDWLMPFTSAYFFNPLKFVFDETTSVNCLPFFAVDHYHNTWLQKIRQGKYRPTERYSERCGNFFSFGKCKRCYFQRRQ